MSSQQSENLMTVDKSYQWGIAQLCKDVHPPLHPRIILTADTMVSMLYHQGYLLLPWSSQADPDLSLSWGRCRPLKISICHYRCVECVSSVITHLLKIKRVSIQVIKYMLLLVFDRLLQVDDHLWTCNLDRKDVAWVIAENPTIEFEYIWHEHLFLAEFKWEVADRVVHSICLPSWSTMTHCMILYLPNTNSFIKQINSRCVNMERLADTHTIPL